MAQPPPDQNFYHHTLPHSHPHPHPHPHPHHHPQLQLPPQFRNPFDLLFDDRTGALNYNYIRPYLPNQMPKPDELSDSLVMRRPRRTRTTFTSSQIAELEQHFLQGRYLTAPRLADLSAKLGLGTAQVKIWFKNRRRRHKIQLDQHKDQSYDSMPLSPSMSNAQKPLDVDPPSLQTLNLGGSVSSGLTPNALTPSPTPSTPTAHHVEHYSEPFNAYYNYNGAHHGAHTQPGGRHVLHGHAQYSTAIAPNATAQFFPGMASMQNGNLHQQSQHQQQHHHQTAPPHHQHTQQLQHQHPQHVTHGGHVLHSHSRALQPHQMQSQQQPTVQMQQQEQQQHYPHHFDGCRVPLIKDEPEADYNFNSSYYMRMSTAAPTALPGVAASMAIEVASALSPGSEVYEPLTPKNDESPSLCNGGGGGGIGSACAIAVGAVDRIDDMDDGRNKKTTLQNLEPLKSSNGVADKPCENVANGMDVDLRAIATVSRIDRSNGCNGIFGKFSKLPAAVQSQPSAVLHEPMHDTNQYQCTMDTLMQAYNPHRNTAGNTQFAYCFN